jgi:arabinofuranosyltransferase
MQRPRWNTVTAVTCASIVAVTATFAVFAWQRRWISDDGLIVVRVAQQIDAGNGPVFNVFERAEPNTSTLWPWLIAAIGLFGAELAIAAVVLGGLCSVAGLALALDATRRWLRARGCASPLAPGSAWIVLGMFPFWDYATSGLETGLVALWIGASWWLLVALRTREQVTRRRELATAIAIGLGPMVRPDLAIVSAVFLVAAWRIVRPARRRTAVLAAAAVALPFGYEIFRAGYYGVLVPLPALAKSVGTSHWGRGFAYLAHFVVPYALWLPLGVLAAWLAVALTRRTFAGHDRTLLAAPIAAGLVLAAYVVRVGGDFMHGRMLLAPTLLVILPALLLPVRRVTAPALALLAGWCVFSASTMRSYAYAGYEWSHDWDERASYLQLTEKENPIRAEDFASKHGAAVLYREAVEEKVPPLVIWDHNAMNVAMDRAIDAPVVMVAGVLGTAGVAIPLDGIVADMLGLANPLGAHITVTHVGRIGHEKQLPWAWLLADYAAAEWDARQTFDPATSPAAIHAARHALTCGELAELLASVRDPLTPGRFWDNLVGAWRRTRLEIPADPFEAERELCP